MKTMTSASAPKVPQTWWDTNRDKYQAETTVTEGEPRKCDHFYVRISPTDIYCHECNCGWIDGGDFTVENGKLLLTPKKS